MCGPWGMKHLLMNAQVDLSNRFPYNVIIVGSLVSPGDCPYVWLGDICEPKLKVPQSKMSPRICMPLSDDFTPLIEICTSLKEVLGCNYMQGLGLVAGLIIINKFSFCPSVILTGNLARGKTTTLTAAMSLLGCDQVG